VEILRLVGCENFISVAKTLRGHIILRVAIINASRMLMSGMDGNGELGLISIEDRFHHHGALLTDLLADRVCG